MRGHDKEEKGKQIRGEAQRLKQKIRQIGPDDSAPVAGIQIPRRRIERSVLRIIRDEAQDKQERQDRGHHPENLSV
jgi:hypothetical protein